MKKSFNIQELLQGKSKRHGTKPMHQASHQELSKDIKNKIWSTHSWFRGSYNYKTKETIFLHRLILSQMECLKYNAFIATELLLVLNLFPHFLNNVKIIILFIRLPAPSLEMAVR